MKTVRNFKLIAVTTLLIAFYNCNSTKENTKNEKDSLAKVEESKIPEVKTGNFYTNKLDKKKSVILADTIVYYTVIKNPDPEDDWQEKCLSRLNRKALTNVIFNAIYNGRLVAYNFMTEQPMTIDEVKALEKEHPRNEIAKMEFSEEWYFNENDLSFSKKVNAIMLGYEERNMAGEVKYFAGVKVYLNQHKKESAKKKNK